MGLYSFIHRKKEEIEGSLLIPQRDSFFSWAKDQNFNEGEQVIVCLSEEVEVFVYRNGDLLKLAKNLSNRQGLQRFILCSKNSFSGNQKFVKVLNKKDVWQKIFSSSFLEVWENSGYYVKDESLPLRLGLSNEEKKNLSGYVRERIRQNLREEPVGFKLPIKRARFSQRQDLDVALWFEGKLRASVIIIGETLESALDLAAKKVLEDTRFKPISFEELNTAGVEITLMSDLVFPLTRQEYVKGDIDETKGYVVTVGKRKGWYLPAVHNVASFSGIQMLFERLLQEKAKVSLKLENVGIKNFGQFEVIDWIEFQQNKLDLKGPVGRKDGMPNKQIVNILFDESISWLKHVMEPDGNIPAVITAEGVRKQFDLVRLGCVGHALACSGNLLQRNDILDMADRIYAYLALPHILKLQTNLAPRVYFLRLSLALDKVVSEKSIEEVVEKIPEVRKDPIVWLQSLSMLIDYEEKKGEVKYRALLSTEVKQAYDEFFEKNKLGETQLVNYAELLPLCSFLHEKSNSNIWETRIAALVAWYIDTQQDDGSFPITPLRSFSYVRGTGKIFESLACVPEYGDPSLNKLLLWLFSMQNNKENLFWAPPGSHFWLKGGFRHDAFNREIWIDAAAHIILGCARYLRSKK